MARGLRRQIRITGDGTLEALLRELTAYPGRSIPNLAPLSLHGHAGGIAHLDPDAARAGSIRTIDLLRHDALSAKPASVRDDDRAVLGNAFVEQDAPPWYRATTAPAPPCVRGMGDCAVSSPLFPSNASSADGAPGAFILNENGSHPGGRSGVFALKQTDVSCDSGLRSGRLTVTVTGGDRRSSFPSSPSNSAAYGSGFRRR
jgi:hypothetical protein